MTFTHWFSNHSEEAIQQFVNQAPGKPYYDNYQTKLGTITKAVRDYSKDFDNVKAVEVTILLKEEV